MEWRKSISGNAGEARYAAYLAGRTTSKLEEYTMKKLLLTLMLALVSTSAMAQQLPNQTDLKAAYCIPILKAGVSGIDPNSSHQARNIMSELRERAESSLRRVQLYLTPRLSYLDPYAIQAAMKSGEDDLVRVSSEFNSQIEPCTQTCMSKAMSDSLTRECITKCTTTETIKRTSSCTDASFLPF